MSVTLDLRASPRRGPSERLSRDGQTSREPDSVESENAQDRPISTAAGRSRVKGWAQDMLPREEGRAGSRMLAYDNIGRRIGRSGTWVRRLLGGEAVGLAHETFERMREAYIRHCEMIEAEAATAAKRASALKAQADAIEQQLARSSTGMPR